ncbi:DUF5825 family protein [Streptomyces sp. NPDC051211]|uniref:DUF5825 family protein n=1 Tax=Streptomyces sp. NPDC051211 TaxID=3154643 RepID=UPI00344D181F
MLSQSADPQTVQTVQAGVGAVTVEAWRDYDPAARALPGMALGRHELSGAAQAGAERLQAAGARWVRLPRPVGLCGDADRESARSLLLIRELTGRGIAVDWVARCGDGCAGEGVLAHLHPPSRIEGAPEQTLRGWRAAYFPGKCVYRRGPGFVEVRDRRFGSLELFTIDEPPFLDAIAALREGTAVATVPPEVRSELAEARLVAEHAGLLWWLPMRMYRWPFGSYAL